MKIDSTTNAPSPNPRSATQLLDDGWIEKMRAKNVGVLVVGHGTRNPDGSQQLIRLTSEIRSRLPDLSVEASFLELCEPDIMQGLAKLKSQGCSELFVIPILLFTAAHAQEDIPEAVAIGCTELGLRVLGQTASLGTHPMVLALSQLRFEQIVKPRRFCEGGHCAWGAPPNKYCQSTDQRTDCCRLGVWHESFGPNMQAINAAGDERAAKGIGLAMVGRGTSDPTARGHMLELTRLRIASTPVAWCQTGFFAGGEVDVDRLLEEAASTDCETIIVQPHLLFEGELMNKLRDKVQAFRNRFPQKAWWLAGCLGADPSLADVFVGLLGESVTSFVGLAK